LPRRHAEEGCDPDVVEGQLFPELSMWACPRRVIPLSIRSLRNRVDVARASKKKFEFVAPEPCAAEFQACGAEFQPCAAELQACGAESQPCAAEFQACGAESQPCTAESQPCAAELQACAAELQACAAELQACAAGVQRCAAESQPCTAESQPRKADPQPREADWEARGHVLLARQPAEQRLDPSRRVAGVRRDQVERRGRRSGVISPIRLRSALRFPYGRYGDFPTPQPESFNNLHRSFNILHSRFMHSNTFHLGQLTSARRGVHLPGRQLAGGLSA
jgi:hypothetical protein